MKEAVLKNFAISQENTCVEARLFNKVAGHQFCIFLHRFAKDPNTGVFL